MWGLLGVIYNSAYIDPAEKDVETWDILWDEELSGDILMFNNSRDAIGIASRSWATPITLRIPPRSRRPPTFW